MQTQTDKTYSPKEEDMSFDTPPKLKRTDTYAESESSSGSTLGSIPV